MDSQQMNVMGVFSISYVMAAFAAIITAGMSVTGRHRWRGGVVALTALGGALFANATAMPGKNVAVDFVGKLWAFDRTQVAVTCAGLLGGLLAAAAIRNAPSLGVRAMFPRAAHLGMTALLALLVLKQEFSPYLAKPGANGNSALPIDRDARGVAVEAIHKLSFAPTSIAFGPDGMLYVAGYAGMAFQNGVVMRLDPPTDGKSYSETLVAGYLNRPHGIAFDHSDLYISRAGQFTRAINGRIIQENTGTVTRAQDLDGDGTYDYFTDVVSGLPGAQQPDGLHQNNGIIFDDAGNLYVTVGAASDHGPPLHPYEGTILRCAPDGTGLVVFARGLRNPYDLAFGPAGKLFCTDNDDNALGLGDELNEIVEGGHYGHPYTATDTIDVEGTNAPLLRSESALQGLAYAPPGSLPSGYDDCLYVASYLDGHINRIRIASVSDGVQAVSEPIAKVPHAIDVVVSADKKSIYACSHDDRAVYRISIQ